MPKAPYSSEIGRRYSIRLRWSIWQSRFFWLRNDELGRHSCESPSESRQKRPEKPTCLSQHSPLNRQSRGEAYNPEAVARLRKWPKGISPQELILGAEAGVQAYGKGSSRSARWVLRLGLSHEGKTASPTPLRKLLINSLERGVSAKRKTPA